MNTRFEQMCSNGRLRNALFWKNLGKLILPGSVNDDWQQLVKILDAQHPVSSLVTRSQHYLWNTVYLLNEENFGQITINRFKLALADCFTDLFPENTVIPIYNWHLPLISLPASGLQIKSPGQNIALHTRGGIITVPGTAGECIVESNSFSEKLQANQEVCMIDNGTWFDPPLSGQMENRKALLKMKPVIEEALELIGSSAPRLHKRIIHDIRSYVLVKSEVLNAHHSFTTQSYPNAIFLSGDERRLTIAEAIVHEFSHNELDSILAFEQIHSGSEEARYYSPWRNDIRPLKGLFHAVYVFNRVLSFYYSIDMKMLTENEQQTVMYKRSLIYHKIKLGLWQIPHAVLEPTALAVYQSIIARMKLIKQTRNEQLTINVQQELTDHIEQWCQKYHPLKPGNPSKIKNILYAAV
jgi:hypothetical protein